MFPDSLSIIEVNLFQIGVKESDLILLSKQESEKLIFELKSKFSKKCFGFLRGWYFELTTLI